MRPLKKGTGVRNALSNLSQEVSAQNEQVRLERALAFIEANKASDVPVAAIPVAATASSAGEVQSAVKDALQEGKKAV